MKKMVLEKGEGKLKGLVFNIMRYSTKDGPGIRTTVFLKGCPLRCQWCHNPEGQDAKKEIIWWEKRCIGCLTCLQICPQNKPTPPPSFKEGCPDCLRCVAACPAQALEVAGKGYTPDELLYEILKDRLFYELSGGGVTFSGGEPLYQSLFLLEILKASKRERLHTAVDTCGYAPTSTILEVARYSDLFLYDLKLMEDSKHILYTGISNKLILKNLRELVKRGKNIVIRFPVIPRITEDEDNLRQIGEFMKELGLTEIVLLPYHKIAQDKYQRVGRDYPLKELEVPSSSRMEKIKEILKRYIPKVEIG